MYRTPSPEPDDEQPEHPYPRRRRRRAETYKLPALHLDNDEGTSRIPKRASLFLNQSPPAEEEPAGAVEVEEEDEDQAEEERRYSQKIMLARRRRHPVYEPPLPSPVHHKRRARSTRYTSAGTHPLTRTPALVIIGTFLLAVLVIGSIAFFAARTQINTGASNSSSATSPNLPPSSNGSSVQGIINPHELVITPEDTDHPPPPVFAQAAYLLDADTGATLYAYNPFMHLPVLSTTKLMTAVLAVEKGGNLDQNITITPAMYNDISQLSGDSALMGIKKGENYTLRDLLYGLFLVSGNDAAVAIAYAVGGNLQTFVAEMNQRARELGLYDTHYMNPHGLLQTGQYSSAHDLAILGRYAFSIPLIQQISATQQYHITKGNNHAEHFLINGNQFLWWYPGVNGGKTGWDAATNFVQVISCVRNHHHLIGVVIHTNNWWTDMRDLMNWGFDSFTWVSPYDVDFQHPIPYDYLWDYFTGDKKDNTVPTADKGRYYIYTGFSISGMIMAYFDHNGGLKKFGYPESMESISGNLAVSQKFDHGTISCDPTTKQCITT